MFPLNDSPALKQLKPMTITEKTFETVNGLGEPRLVTIEWDKHTGWIYKVWTLDHRLAVQAGNTYPTSEAATRAAKRALKALAQ